MRNTSSTDIPKTVNVAQIAIASGGTAVALRLRDTGRRTLGLSGTSWLEAHAASGADSAKWSRDQYMHNCLDLALAHASTARDKLSWIRHRTRDKLSYHPRLSLACATTCQASAQSTRCLCIAQPEHEAHPAGPATPEPWEGICGHGPIPAKHPLLGKRQVWPPVLCSALQYISELQQLIPSSLSEGRWSLPLDRSRRLHSQIAVKRQHQCGNPIGV